MPARADAAPCPPDTRQIVDLERLKTTSRWSGAKRMIWAFAAVRPICGFAAGPLPAHRRGTRREYVRVGSYAASMPRKVPRRWAGKDQST
ncbi:hypothetical protein CFBP2533_14290 [Xanthomonas hortorum pv. pelargonii]|uniref:Uncharacterized protein n=1 Tax=Xanthomonas hortorum pv. pelargonii TaxID=453602 RepID=A0A6V7CLJ8_9XANT|nr:hypothetical protein CFBP2533_14290 [Xanthomonas hortorum pv. pelargonii]CAD0318049.1 hypothetical protein CFBP2533_14290 [Xanthomonas hortorum pv. pelargonii]